MLARWAGWGALPQVFDAERPEWSRFRDALTGMLSPAEHAAARASTINAHYTSAEIVEQIWGVAVALGFTGGRVLEPGCGSGNFIGFAPPGAQLVGVEADPITARIAQLLYPDADVRSEGFERSRLAPGSFDLAVGNVPFAKVALFDPVHNRGRHSMHNHFIVKAVDLTRPGGLIVLLTSHYTLDAANPAARLELASAADLLGAVRLPSNAFAASSGTSVVADLLVLRRRAVGEPPSPVRWEHSGPVELAGGSVPVNEYFTARPEQILGVAEVGSGLYGRELLVTRAGGGATLAESLHEAGRRLVADAEAGHTAWPPPTPAPQPRSPAPPRRFGTRSFRRPDGSTVTLVDTEEDGRAVHGIDPDNPGALWTAYLDESTEITVPAAEPARAAPPPRPPVKEGGFLLDLGGALVLRMVDGQPVAHTAKPQRDLPELRQLILLRDALIRVLQLQAGTSTDEAALATAQGVLGSSYDATCAATGR